MECLQRGQSLQARQARRSDWRVIQDECFWFERADSAQRLICDLVVVEKNLVHLFKWSHDSLTDQVAQPLRTQRLGINEPVSTYDFLNRQMLSTRGDANPQQTADTER